MTPCVLIKCKSTGEWVKGEPCCDGRGLGFSLFRENKIICAWDLLGNYFILSVVVFYLVLFNKKYLVK